MIKKIFTVAYVLYITNHSSNFDLIKILKKILNLQNKPQYYDHYF